MDDNQPHSKVLPFPAKRSDQSSEPCRDPAIDEFHAAILEAVKEAEWSPKHVDQAVIDSEERFLERFKFDAPRAHRELLIAFKHQADLTDRDIRLLRRSGSLIFGEASVDLAISRARAMWGGVQIAAVALVMSFPFLITGFRRDINLKAIIAIIVIECTLTWFIQFLDQIYIRPYWIRKRVERRLGQRSPFHVLVPTESM